MSDGTSGNGGAAGREGAGGAPGEPPPTGPSGEPEAAPPSGPPEAYQAAGRVSPGGYVFLAGVTLLLMGFAWWRVEGESGPVVVAWMFVAILMALGPIAWHAVDFFQAVAGRRGLAGTFVFLTLAFGIGVFVLLSALNVAKKENERWNPAIDLTRSGQFTLGDESKRILEGLGGGTVYVTYLEHNGAQTDLKLRAEVQEQLRVYARASDRIELSVFDAFRQREETVRHLQSVGVPKPTSGEDVDLIVLSYAEKGKEVAAGRQKEVRVEAFTFRRDARSIERERKWLGERVITSAIQELVYQRYKVYVTGGHGEKSLADDLRAVRERLSAQNLEIAEGPLDLVAQGKVPDDCDLLLVAGPAAPFSPEEAGAIGTWLARGRSLVVLLDPDDGGRRETGLESVLEPFGLAPRVNYLVHSPRIRSAKLDTGEVHHAVEMSTELVAWIPEYAQHPAVRAIREGSGFRTVFLKSTFVEIDDDPKPGVESATVIYAPEVQLQGLAPGQDVPKPHAARIEPGRRDLRVPDPGRDKVGTRLALVAAATRAPEGEGTAGVRDARVVVSGDTDAFTDYVTRQYGPNLDLFTGLVQWSLGREDLVAVSDRTIEMELVDLDERKERMAFWWPFVSTTTALLAGAAVWWSRRR